MKSELLEVEINGCLFQSASIRPIIADGKGNRAGGLELEPRLSEMGRREPGPF